MFGEIIDLSQVRGRQDQVEVKLRTLQKRTNSDAFLIITAKDTGKFIQFARVENGDLLLDVPLQGLTPREKELAQGFFDRLSKSYGEDRVGMGRAGQVPQSYQMDCKQDIDDAAGVATAFFDLVFQTPQDAPFIFEEN